MRCATFIAVLAMLCLVGCSIERAGGLIVDTGMRSGGSDAGGVRFDAGGSLDADMSTVERDAGPPEPDAGCVARGGMCEPGATSSTTEPCGNCGMRSVELSCNVLCLWEPRPGPCTGEGECAPGSVTELDDRGCTECVRRIQNQCSDSCGWVPLHAPGCDSADTCDVGGVDFCEGSRGAGFECCDGGAVAVIGFCGT